MYFFSNIFHTFCTYLPLVAGRYQTEKGPITPKPPYILKVSWLVTQKTTVRLTPSKTRSNIAQIAGPILTSTSLDDVKALRYFGAKHPPFEQIAFTYLFSLSSTSTKDRILSLTKMTLKYHL